MGELIDNRTMMQKIIYFLRCKTYKARLKLSRALGRVNDPIPF